MCKGDKLRKKRMIKVHGLDKSELPVCVLSEWCLDKEWPQNQRQRGMIGEISIDMPGSIVE